MKVKYTITYKNYPDCPEATKVSKFWANPVNCTMVSLPICFALIGFGGLLYNLEFKVLQFLGTLFMILGLLSLFVLPFLLSWLSERLRFSDRVYEKRTGKKLD